MLNENIITIDFKKIDDAIKTCTEDPIIIMMNIETMMAFAGQKELNPNIDVQEQEFEQIVTYRDIPIIGNPFLDFGEVIVK